MSSTPADEVRPAARRQGGHLWVALRKVSQGLFLAAFLLLFLMGRRDAGWPTALLNAPFRLDPLTVLAHLIASRTFQAGSALAGVSLVLALVFGRAWCGWICPLGTCLDLFPLKGLRRGAARSTEGWRAAKFLLVYVLLTSSLFGSLFLLALDPLTLLYRSLNTAVWPALDRLVLALEQALFRIPFLQPAVAALDAALRPAVFQSEPAHYQNAFLFGAMFLGVILLNLVAERFWCRSLCPLGGLLGLLAKLSFFQRRTPSDCRGCLLCAQVCPTGTIDPRRGHASDPAECTLCLACLQACPAGRTVFSFQPPRPGWADYDPGRAETLAAIGTTGAAVLLLRGGALARRAPDHLLRPPGVHETEADPLAMPGCVRCSACLRTCPTNALQPGALEAGLEGFGAPLLVPRLGYCDYSCNACGQVCPVQAIPALTLSEKQTRRIGSAYIDVSRCLAWADHINCLVCEEMCPLPQKAIRLEEQELTGPDGFPVRVKLPSVLREACIGCGICEYKCPLEGQAAIRVYSPQTPPLS